MYLGKLTTAMYVCHTADKQTFERPEWMDGDRNPDIDEGVS